MKKLMIILIITTIFFICNFAIGEISDPAMAEVNSYTYKIINTYPHDKNAFTQGLIYRDGYLYEGTGLRGHSSLRQIELNTGKVKKIHHLPDRYFGEGITIYNEKIYQLTWESEVCFVYNLNFKLLDQFNYQREGWGLTNNDDHLIMSDGTDKLYFINPDDFTIEKSLQVTMDNKPVKNINELEYIKGMIYANIWRENIIIKIDPMTGEVDGIIDLEGIIDPANYDYELNVLNGIAYDRENDRLFVTGKLWPIIFEIELKLKK